MLKLLAGLGIFVLVAFAMAVHSYREATGKWLNPRLYIKELWRHWCIFLSAFHGKWTVQFPKAGAGDNKWAVVSKADHLLAMISAKGQMAGLGVDGQRSYKKLSYDCENHAQLLKALYDVFMRNCVEEGFGIPTRVQAYRKDNGTRHAVFVVDVEGEERWFEPYAFVSFREIYPSDAEKRNVWAIVKG